MDFKVNKEMIAVNEVIYENVQEQSVELDYILPDYYPEIFKLVKCQLTPRIVSRNINGDRATYELAVNVRIMYCSENNNQLHCVHQKLNYSKTVEFGKSGENMILSLYPKVDYVNCRAVNQRRIDMRGAISIKVKATGEQKQEVICDAFGMNSQLKKNHIQFAANKIISERAVTLDEEIELNMSKPPVISIIRSDASLTSIDKKIVANKLVVKGETVVDVLYSCEKDGGSSLEPMQFTIPYSQIVDMQGIDDNYECTIHADVNECNVSSSVNNEGDAKILKCEVTINLSCIAIKSSSTELVTDAYSTTYPCEFTTSNIRVEQPPIIIDEIHQTKTTIEYKEGELDCIYDVFCTVNNINTSIIPEQKKFTVTGMAHYCIIARNQSGMPVMIEKDETFEHNSASDNITESSTIEAFVSVMSCSFTMSSSNTVTVKADLKINTNLYSSSECKIITDLNFDDSTVKTHDGDYALKLYYGIENEDIWEIAKRYSSSVKSIMEENNLSHDKLTSAGMILIPILS